MLAIEKKKNKNSNQSIHQVCWLDSGKENNGVVETPVPMLSWMQSRRLARLSRSLSSQHYYATTSYSVTRHT